MSKSKSVVVSWPSGSRVYSEEDHGKDWLKLAKDFASKDESRVLGSAPVEEAEEVKEEAVAPANEAGADAKEEVPAKPKGKGKGKK